MSVTDEIFKYSEENPCFAEGDGITVTGQPSPQHADQRRRHACRKILAPCATVFGIVLNVVFFLWLNRKRIRE